MCAAEQATLATQEPVELEASTGGLSTNTARLILAGVAAVYGSNYPTVKLLDEWLVCVPAAAVLRFSLAVLLLIPVLLHAARDEPRVLHYPLARDGLEVGFLFGLGYIAQATALEASPAGLQAFLLSLTVIVCPVCESAFEGTRQPMRVWLAALLSAVGVAALEGGDVGGLGGGAIGLWQPVLFGVGFYRLECAMRRHCHPTEQVEVMAAEAEGMAAEGMAAEASSATGHSLPKEAALPTLEAEFALTAACASSVDACTLERQAAAATRAAPIEPSTAALALTAWQMASVLAVAAAWLALDAGGPAAFAGSVHEAFGTSLTRPEVAAALLWTGTVTTAGCAYLEATAMARLSSSDAMVIFASEPLWACLFAWAAIGESVGPPAMVGGALILSACLLSASEGAESALIEATEGAGGVLRGARMWAVSLRRRVDVQARAGVEAGFLGLLGFGPAIAEAIEKVEEAGGGGAGPLGP